MLSMNIFLILLVIALIVCNSLAFGTYSRNNRMGNRLSRHQGRGRSRLMLNSSDDNASETIPEDKTDDKEEIKPLTSNPFRLGVLRMGLTEPAWTSSFNYQKKEGDFSCAYCGQKLFNANAKYDSGSGWPSFWRTDTDGAVALYREWDGRVECKCSRCDSHLGHVFMDGPKPSDVDSQLFESVPASDPKGRNSSSRLPRFCMNGASLKFDEKE
mmetsp:Transcript_13249/g.18764  ORF Transcript_13249/g.18764 Transcript_13249/m.18764 type:complete len:213 (-) Transcript_13249:925-1563(-)